MATEFKFSPGGKVGLYEPIGAPVRWHGLYKYVEPSSNWRVQTQSTVDSSFRILIQSEFDLGWRIFGQLDSELGWLILAQLDSEFGWKLFNQKEFDCRWEIGAGLSANCSWVMGVMKRFFSTWTIYSGSVRFKNPSTGKVEWYEPRGASIYWKGLWGHTEQACGSLILTEKDYSSSFKIFAQNSPACKWFIRAILEKTSSWKLFHQLDADISWYIRAFLSSESKWYIRGKADFKSATKIFTQSNQDIKWYIRGDCDIGGSWKIWNEPKFQSSWDILHGFNILSSWVCDGIDDGPIIFSTCHKVQFKATANPVEFQFKLTPIDGFDKAVFAGDFMKEATPVVVDDSDTIEEDFEQEDIVSGLTSDDDVITDDTIAVVTEEEVLDFFKAVQKQYHIYSKNSVEYNHKILSLNNKEIKVTPLGFQFFSKRK